MSQITDLRRQLRAAVEPLLKAGEYVLVSAAPSDYQAGLSTLRFTVAVTVGEVGSDKSAERLDELLEPEGGVKAALSEAKFTVSKSSGYRTYQGPNEPVLGAEWTAETVT